MPFFFVTEENPRQLDEQIASEFPLLHLQTTSNSGAFWGDGDLRAAATDYGEIQFALESKVRFSACYKTLKPKPDEWEKAMGSGTYSIGGQLRVRNRQAIRLFFVYHALRRDFAVSMPEDDAVQLESLGMKVGGEPGHMRRRGQAVRYRYFDYKAFLALYDQLPEHASDP